MSSTSRRTFLIRSMAATAAIATPLASVAHGMVRNNNPGPFTISIFSKNLHWLDYDAMASAVKQMGFDGIDLTVRPLGHVLPENAAKDLPKATDAIRKAGLEVWMITTAIVSAEDPLTESVLKTASSLGIGYYRTGWIPYNTAISITDNLKAISKNLSALASLSKKYGIRALYQNHSGTSFGAPLWDLSQILEEINSPWIGSQYDLFHATVEGANSWPLGFQKLTPYVGSLNVKDFLWKNTGGKWKTQTVPLGEGMVDFKAFFGLVKKYGIRTPFSVHYEYPLGGAEDGAKSITMPREQVLGAMKKDLMTLRTWLTEEGLG